VVQLISEDSRSSKPSVFARHNSFTTESDIFV